MFTFILRFIKYIRTLLCTCLWNILDNNVKNNCAHTHMITVLKHDPFVYPEVYLLELIFFFRLRHFLDCISALSRLLRYQHSSLKNIISFLEQGMLKYEISTQYFRCQKLVGIDEL